MRCSNKEDKDMTKTEEIRALLGISRAEFARKYKIPIRTLEDWDSGKSNPPAYVVELLERAVKEDIKKPPCGEWLRMSELSEKEDDRYMCSRCGNVVRHTSKMNLYTFNRWCGRCGSDNDRKGREYNMILYKVRSTFLGGDKPIDSYFDTKEKAQEFLDERCDNGEIIKVEVKANYELNYNHDGCSFGDLTYGDFDATEEELD
jgi:putative transcriptional regulator